MFGRKKKDKPEPLTDTEVREALQAFTATADELDLQQEDQPDSSEMRSIRVRMGRLRDAATLLTTELATPKPNVSIIRAAIQSGNAALTSPTDE